MIDSGNKDEWLKQLIDKLKRCFSERLLLVAHVGSWARDDAEETSDIDVNVILDTVQAEDVLAYREIVESMPDKQLACGFLGSKKEMENWPKYDLIAFYYGCQVLYGDITDVIPAITKENVYDNTMVMLSNINHAVRHSIIYDADIEKASEIAKDLYKAAFFVIQGWYILSHDEYCGKRKEMLTKDIKGIDALVIRRYLEWDGYKSIRGREPMETLTLLERWSSKMFERMAELKN